MLATFSFGKILKRCWTPAIRHTLPAAMGIAPVPFPDNDQLHPWPWAEAVFIAIWAVMLAAGGLYVV